MLDISLPGATGWELLERLRESSSYRHIPVLVSTGLPPEEVIDRAEGLLAHHMSKPYSPVELVSRLEAMLNDAQLLFGAAPALRKPTTGRSP